MQKILYLLRHTLSPLYDERERNAIIEMLVEETCGWTRNDYLTHRTDILPEDIRQRLTGYAAQMAQGIPVQQVLGYAEFMGRKFKVTADTLIPRPETAELVNWVINDWGKVFHKDIQSVVDIGTGSGCIAISLALAFKDVNISAIDLSTAALRVAKENAESLCAKNIDFIHMDILKPEDNHNIHRDIHIPEEIYSLPAPRYEHHDIIISNPPYICESEAGEMSAVVYEHEPHMALFVPDKDPMLFYRAIARYGMLHLNPGGVLYLEINERYGKDISDLLGKAGYADISVRRDMNGKNRMARAIKQR